MDPYLEGAKDALEILREELAEEFSPEEAITFEDLNDLLRRVVARVAEVDVPK